MAESTTRRQLLALAGGTTAAALAGCVDSGLIEGSNDEHAGITGEMTAYVVPYHWGFAAFDEHGQELEQIELEPGTELTIHAVNDHAYDAFEELPDPVAEQLEEFDGLARTKERVEAGELPEPEDATVEEVYDKSHGHGYDDDHDDGHGHGDDHDDGHGHDDHDDGHGHDDDHDDGHGHDDDHDDGHGHGDDHDDGHGHDDDHDDGHDHDHEDALLDHGFQIEDSEINIQVPADTDELVTASDVFEDPGTYQVHCTVHCGYYHVEQSEDLIVVTE